MHGVLLVEERGLRSSRCSRELVLLRATAMAGRSPSGSRQGHQRPSTRRQAPARRAVHEVLFSWSQRDVAGRRVHATMVKGPARDELSTSVLISSPRCCRVTEAGRGGLAVSGFRLQEWPQLGAAGNPQLGVHSLEMVLHRPGGEHEPPGDLGAGETLVQPTSPPPVPWG